MLKDKTALVTGAGRGIGRAISKMLAENGAEVILNYNRSEGKAAELARELEQFGSKIHLMRADVSKRDDVKDMFSKIRKTIGKLDILVNNAGILRDNLLLMTPENDYNDQMDVNLKGTFLCMQYGAKLMMKKSSGKIINLSSVIGRFGNSGQVVYGGTKAGVIGMTTSAAKELGVYGITVNAVAPGLIDTEMTQEMDDAFKNKLLDNCSLKRIGTPEDVAGVVLFLASGLSDYVSGQIIGVDGCQII